MSFSAAILHAALEASVPAEAGGLVVALSGGPDSAALLRATAALGKNFRSLPLRASACRSRFAVRRCRFSRSLHDLMRTARHAAAHHRCGGFARRRLVARSGGARRTLHSARAAKYSRGNVCSRRIIARIKRRRCCCRHCAAPASKACRPCRCAARSERAGTCGPCSTWRIATCCSSAGSSHRHQGTR